jgi:hypothetical protein
LLAVQLAFNPQVLYCAHKQVCPIRREEGYMQYTDNVTQPVNYCLKCWKEIEAKTVPIPAEMTEDGVE